MEPAFLLAHVSDLHVTRPRLASPRDIASKRFLGWLSWLRKRRLEHRPEVLAALIEDLAGAGADHVAVTGDLTHVGLPREIAEAVPWLERLGGPERVSLIPGNHDAYARGERFPEVWSPWADYLCSSPQTPEPASKPEIRFPSVRRVGPVALVGVCSAVPTGPFEASGRLGEAQCAELEESLVALGQEGCFRVVMVHHSPVPGVESPRRALRDAGRFGEAVARGGAELVLHGHGHKTQFDRLVLPGREVPVVGAGSASGMGRKGVHRLARYHLLRLPAGAAPGSRIACQVRRFDPESGVFRLEAERSL